MKKQIATPNVATPAPLFRRHTEKQVNKNGKISPPTSQSTGDLFAMLQQRKFKAVQAPKRRQSVFTLPGERTPPKKIIKSLEEIPTFSGSGKARRTVDKNGDPISIIERNSTTLGQGANAGKVFEASIIYTDKDDIPKVSVAKKSFLLDEDEEIRTQQIRQILYEYNLLNYLREKYPAISTHIANPIAIVRVGNTIKVFYECLPQKIDAEDMGYEDWVSLMEKLRLLHEIGVIHRDIKAENIRKTAEGEIVVIDFESVKYLVDQSEEKFPDTEDGTRLIVGTPGRIAPECYQGNYIKKSDVFSLGAMMLHAFTTLIPLDFIKGEWLNEEVIFYAMPVNYQMGTSYKSKFQDFIPLENSQDTEDEKPPWQNDLLTNPLLKFVLDLCHPATEKRPSFEEALRHFLETFPNKADFDTAKAALSTAVEELKYKED